MGLAAWIKVSDEKDDYVTGDSFDGDGSRRFLDYRLIVQCLRSDV